MNSDILTSVPPHRSRNEGSYNKEKRTWLLLLIRTVNPLGYYQRTRNQLIVVDSGEIWRQERLSRQRDTQGEVPTRRECDGHRPGDDRNAGGQKETGACCRAETFYPRCTRSAAPPEIEATYSLKKGNNHNESWLNLEQFSSFTLETERQIIVVAAIGLVDVGPAALSHSYDVPSSSQWCCGGTDTMKDRMKEQHHTGRTTTKTNDESESEVSSSSPAVTHS